MTHRDQGVVIHRFLHVIEKAGSDATDRLATLPLLE